MVIIANKEVTMNEINNKVNEIGKMSPNEFMQKGKDLGYFADAKELRQIQEFSTEKMLPKEGGEWSGEKGNSIWQPHLDEAPKKPEGNNKTWCEILEPYNKEGVEFKENEPDFSPFAEISVKIDDFSDKRNANFTQADEICAEQWSKENKDNKQWTPDDMQEYRKENNLSWHERSDMRTLDLVPQEIHGNIPHSGGISAYKNTIQGA